MSPGPRPLVAIFAWAALATAADPAQATGKAHEHGAVKLDVAIEGQKLSIEMDAPLDNLLGFERAPRNDAERQAAAAVLARLRAPQQGQPLFRPDAAAQCTLVKAEVRAPVLEPATKFAVAAKGQAKKGPPDQEVHADVEAQYEFSCAQPQLLGQLGLGLFEAYKRIQRIDVQVAGPKGQTKATLKRPASQVPLAR